MTRCQCIINITRLLVAYTSCTSGSPASTSWPARGRSPLIPLSSAIVVLLWWHLLLIYLSARSNFRAVSIISAAAWMRPAFFRSRAFFSGKSTAVGVCAIARSMTLMASSSCPSHSRQWAWRYNAQASLVGVVLSPLAKVPFDESASACVFAMSRTFRQHDEPRHRPSTTSPGEGAHNLSSALPRAGAPLLINRPAERIELSVEGRTSRTIGQRQPGERVRARLFGS